MFNTYNLILTVYYTLLPPLGYAAYSLSYAAVVKYQLDHYVIFAPWILLLDDRGVLVLNAERDGLEKRIDELRNRVIRGDCVEVMRRIPANSIDLAIADPPYNIGEKGKTSKSRGEIRSMEEITGGWEQMDSDEYLLWVKEWVAELYRLLKKTGNAVVFFDRFNTTYLRDIGEEVGFHPLNKFYLGKRNPPPRRLKNNFVSATEEAMVFAVDKKERKFNYLGEKKMKNLSLVTVNEQVSDHPTEKPISPLRDLIKIFTDPGDLVFDPFAGSGSTLVAAQKTGREWLGIEVNPTYVEMAEERLNANCRKLDEYRGREGNWNEPKDYEELPVPTNRKNRRLEEF